jgi:O-antigen/teichoic acid export membrane protein
VWTIAGIGGAQLLRLGSNLVLTRLLFPEVFGLMALVFVLIQGVQMFSDMGIGPSIIQNRRGDDCDFVNTAWTMQILRGAAIWLGCLLMTWPMAWFYGELRLLWLLPVVGLTALVSGFNSTARFTVHRHLVLGKLTAFELGAQILATVVMIVWAWLSPTIWALVAGAIVRASAQMALSHRLLDGPGNRIRWDRDAVWAVIGFGKWMFLATAIGFLGNQMDRLIFPKLISFELMGVYTIAFMLSRVPDTIVVALSSKVIFPAVSQRAHLPRDELRSLVLRNRWPLLCVLALPLALMAGLGDLVVRFLYDERYHEAGWMLSLLALGLWPRMLTNTLSPSLLAVGQPRYFAYAGMLRMLIVGVGLPSAYYVWGIPGAVTVAALGPLGEYAVESYGLWREHLLGLAQDLKTTALWVGLVAAVLLARVVAGIGVPFVPSS